MRGLCFSDKEPDYLEEGMWITQIKDYDKKRREVILDDGALHFLLYAGELRAKHLKAETELSEEAYRSIVEEILKPRARKRVLYYLKDSDKTRAQVLTKLRQGMYPQEVIDDALQFLEAHRFVDDRRYAENYIEELKGKKSRREIAAKLYARGISGAQAREIMEEALGAEDEYEACRKALSGKLGRKASIGEEGELPPDEKRRAYAFLARKGFSGDAIEYSFRHLKED